jgi:uncharacterized protein YwqG
LTRLRHLDLSSNPIKAVESLRALADAKKVLLTVTEPETRQDDAGLVKTLWPWVKQHELLAWKPVVKRGDGPATGSKFAGTPWLARGESWPACGSCRQPMQLLVQLNLGQLPKKASDRFGRGLLQLFYCSNYENINCGSSRKSHFVRIVESHPAAPLADIPATIQAQRDPPRTIIGWKERLDYPSLKELRKLGLAKCGLVDQKQLDFGDDEDTPAMEKLDRCITSDKLAGWPKWPQDVNCPKCPQCKERMELLFQLASDDNTPQVFGDDGFGYIFQCQSHNNAVAFSWDSY